LASDLIDNPEVPGAKIPAVRSIRDDPLAWLLSRAMIDQAQFTAGRRWQLSYEAAGIAAIRAMDPLKEPVDGGLMMRADITDRQMKAFRMLAAAKAALGTEGHWILIQVLGRGLFVTEVARLRGFSDNFSARYYGRRLRECLELLARAWGYAGQPKHR
jgi:hypothetical protein